MLKEHWRAISRFQRLGDNILIAVSFYVAYYFRAWFVQLTSAVVAVDPIHFKPLGRIELYIIVLGMALPLYNGILSMLGGYQRLRFASAWSLFKTCSLSSVICFFTLGSFFYLLKLDLSRSFVIVFCGVSGVLLFVERYCTLMALRYFRAQGKNFRNIAIVGTGEQARNLYLELARQSELGVRVVGFIALERGGALRRTVGGGIAMPRSSVVYDLPARVVADVDSFEAVLKRCAIDEVLFTNVKDNFSTVEELAKIAAEEGVRVSLAADFFALNIMKSEMSYLGDAPLIHYRPFPADDAALVVKRALDLSLSFLLLLLLSPIMLLAAIAVKLDSAGPVFFKQRRVGLSGRVFVLLKFRSMIVDAEAQLGKLREQNEMQGPVFKMKRDPRVTKVGRVLRRYSIDELPQLINVLKGDMSLVGPRPPLPHEVSMYVRKHRRRLSMRPGLTCTWQVSGRNEIASFEKWAELDLAYIDNWSLGTDVKLLLKTIPAVIRGSGAS